MARLSLLRGLGILAALALGSPARAEFLTGDPSADGWSASNTSLQSGSYIRGRGNFSFDMYRTAYDLTAGSPLTLMASPWSVGDRVLAMGGVVVPKTASDASWAAFTGEVVNSKLSASVRIVSKFTSSPSAWSASGVAPGQGNGAGSYSNGDGGPGAVLVSTATGYVTLAGAGVLGVPTNVNQWDGTVGSNGLTVSNVTTRVIYTTDSGGKLQSWELFLNTTLLAGENTGQLTPTQAGRWNQSLQSGQSSVFLTDGLLPAVNAVPAPATWLLLGTGIAGLGLGRWRSTKPGSGDRPTESSSEL